MAGELKLNQVATPTTPAAGKAALFVGTDKIPHFLDEAGANGIEPPVYLARLTATYTLASSASLQKAFNVPANGALTLPANTAYFFECMLLVDTMSATSGNFGFSIIGAGTATISNQNWFAHGLDATTQTTPGAVGGTSNVAALTTDVVVAATGTAVHVYIRGTFSITTGGTIIPSIQLTTAAAAVVKIGSFFRVERIGLDTVTTQGPWA